ncbi:MAG: hypothetical protein OXB88_07790 [Bacteriovoracales bacterium]|nr:hypothetical protein [Bacteriovoracales bacterium]
MNVEFLQKIGPQTFAIVWITDTPLGPDCPHYSTFHYLLGGTLRPRERSEMGFFQGTHYGKKLFLLHTVWGKTSIAHIKQFHNLIHSHRSHKAQMVFVGKDIPCEVEDLIDTRLRSEYDIVVFKY